MTEPPQPPVTPDVADATTPAFPEEKTAEEPLVATASLPIGVPLSLPRPGASPREDRLAAANAAARRDSLERLAVWFPEYDFEEAAQNVDARRFMVVLLGDALLEHL